MRDIMYSSGPPLPELEQLLGRIREVPTMFPVDGIEKGHFADACLGLSDEILEAENILRTAGGDSDAFAKLSLEAKLALFFVPKGPFMASLKPPEFQASEAGYFRGSELRLTGLFDVAPANIYKPHGSLSDLRSEDENMMGETFPIDPLADSFDPYFHGFVAPRGGAVVARFEESRGSMSEKAMAWYKVAQYAGRFAVENAIWVGGDGSFTSLRRVYVTEPEGGFSTSVGTYAEPSPMPEKSWALQMLQALAPAETRRYHPYILNQRPENSPLAPNKKKNAGAVDEEVWAEPSPSSTESDEQAQSWYKSAYDSTYKFLLGYFAEEGGLDNK